MNGEGRVRTEELRVGDAERDEVASALHEHFAQGRLDRAELDERLASTLSAKTVGDLMRVTRDLPVTSGITALGFLDGGRPPGGRPRGPAPWDARAAYHGRPGWPAARRRDGQPAFAPLFFLAVLVLAAFTRGWFLVPLFAWAWLVFVFVAVRRVRRWRHSTWPRR